MTLTTRALTLGVAMSLTPAWVWAQSPDSAPTRSLIEQAQYWQQRGRGDRAVEAWQKLLKIVPDHVDALIGLTQLAVDAGDVTNARQYLQRLKAAHPRDTRLPALESRVTMASPERAAQLEEARDLAREGKPEEAAQRYKRLTDGKPPTDPMLALEYYQAVGGARGGWEEGYAGLQQLARDNPKDPQVAVALAEYMTYSEDNRRKGIEALSKLTGKSDLGKRAKDSWRRALLWLGSTPSDLPYYQAWLRQYPDDDEVRQRISASTQRRVVAAPPVALTAADRAAAEAGKAVAAAYGALGENDLTQARARFTALLAKRPDDSVLIGGLGLIELRESNYAEAERLLEKASRSSPSRWREALGSARYWHRFDQARRAREAGQPQQALELLRATIRLQPSEPAGQQALADVLAETGHYDEAEAVLKGLIKRRPDDIDSLRSLIGVYTQQGHFDQALALADTLSPEQRQKIGSLGQMRAERYRRQATDAETRGDIPAARTALEQALVDDPSNVWVRLSLAKLYMRDNQYTEARGLVDGLLISDPDLPDALYASALLSGDAQDWPKVIETLQAIRPEARTKDMVSLYRQAWVRQQVATANQLSHSQQSSAAITLLQQIEPQVGNDPDLLSAVAAGYADAGDSRRALKLIRSLMAASGKPDTGLTLRYAGVLLASRQQVELLGVLRQLEGMPMDALQRDNFESLREGYLLQQADTLRESGDLEAAYDRLAPILANQPDHPGALAALARLYTASGQASESRTIYDQLLQRQPRNPDLLLSAAMAALGGRQLDRAQTLIDQGLQLRPQDPNMLATAARVARARGNTRDAEQLLRAAVAAEEAAKASVNVPAGAVAPRSDASATGSGAAGSNPFAGRVGRRPSSLPTVPTGTVKPAAAVTVPGVSAQAPMLPNSYQVGLAGPVSVAKPVKPVVEAAAGTPLVLDTTVDPAAANLRQATPVASAPVIPAKGVALALSDSNGSSYGALPAPLTPSDAIAPPSTTQPLVLTGAQGGEASGSGSVPQTLAQRMATPSAPVNKGLRGELAELEESRATSVQVGTTFRRHSGEAGLSAMNDLRFPIEFQTAAGDGRLSLQLTPTLLDAGTPDTAYATASRFGGGPAVSLSSATGHPGAQTDRGVAISVGYALEGFDLRLGVTPLGFQFTDITGNLGWRGMVAEGTSLGVNLSRRQVEDSVLSLAGAHDSRSGDTWGGVMSTGLRLDLSGDIGLYTLYGWGEYASLTGHGVASNQKFELGAGLNYRLVNTPTETLTAGVRLSAMAYQYNLGYFTVGHGGYFSPQSFAALSVPVDWRIRYGRSTFELGGSLGLQVFRQDSASYFPDDATRQSKAVAAATKAVNAPYKLATVDSHAVYSGYQSKPGLAYEVHGRFLYQLSQRMQLIGQLGLDNVGDYHQFAGGISLRYAWPTQSEPAAGWWAPSSSPTLR